MQLATQVNKSLKSEEKQVLDAIEKQLGKPIERITADPEQETSKNTLWKIPWVNMDFDPRKFPCHYIALNGEIILLSLFNLGLSEIPTGILNLKNLTGLCLASNNITDLPKAFSNLKSLEGLNLNNNQFTKVPDSIIELPRLHNVYMKNNKISEIPVTLTDSLNARFKDPSYRGSIYLPCNLIFSGNPIEHSSLSKEQELLVKGTGIFDLNTYSTIHSRINLVID
jgi:Leucine-rich repeat (LRR) protein